MNTKDFFDYAIDKLSNSGFKNFIDIEQTLNLIMISNENYIDEIIKFCKKLMTDLKIDNILINKHHVLLPSVWSIGFYSTDEFLARIKESANRGILLFETEEP